MIAIVVSRADSASEHIGEHLLRLADWEERTDDSRPDAAGGGVYYRTEGFELREFDALHVDLDDPTPAFGTAEGDVAATDEADAEVDALVFVSRHSGETGALLTAHFTGNFGPAEYGGSEGALARAAPGTQKRVVDALAARAPDGYDVGIECTHHGPTAVAVPSLFVELGSSEEHWEDAEAASAVARAVLDLRGTGPDLVGDDGRRRHVVGFGGGHYAPRFTRIVAETEWAVGHVGAEWTLAAMGAPDANRDVIDRAFERSRTDYAVVDGDRPDLLEVISELGYRVVSETWVRAVGDRPLALVTALERDLARVADGLRFGDVVPAVRYGDAADGDADAADTADAADADAVQLARDALVSHDLPAELLADAQGIDPGGARAAVERRTVAFETEQAGTRAAGRAAFAVEDGRDVPSEYAALVADLAGVLRERYDEVVVESDTVVAREEAFDPALAAKLGVPEGPAFGRLADGDPVEVNGETIPPHAVSRASEDRFPLPVSIPEP